MSHIYFASEEEWKFIREWGEYDYVVIGSGFCSLAFVDQIRKNDEKLKKKPSKILVLERGYMYLLPTHFQNLPPVFSETLPNQVVLTEIFPWSVATTSVSLPYANWMHGMIPFFGGRSTLWSAWCPRPSLDEKLKEVHNWPKEVVDMMKKDNFFERAEKLLNVTKSDTINSFVEKKYGTNVFLEEMNKALPSLVWSDGGSVKGKATRVMAAPLAVGDPDNYRNDFTKYSVVADYLELIQADKKQAKKHIRDRNLVVVTNCIVQKLLRDETCDKERVDAVAIQTSRGVLPLSRHGKKTPKVILAVGCMPAATLLLNSFEFKELESKPELLPQFHNVAKPHLPGSSFGAHTISSITVRIPKQQFKVDWSKTEVSLGAYYLAGVVEDGTNVGSFHAQISMLQDPHPRRNASTAHKYMPDVVATATPEQLADSQDYAVFVFAILGEMEIGGKNGLVKNHQTNDPTCNVTLRWDLTKFDLKTWDAMEDISRQLIVKLSGDFTPEYWNTEKECWSKDYYAFRVPGMVHESSVLPMTGKDGLVDFDFRPRGVENVYVTGSSLWPTAASWNPTMTMCAFSQVLADNLSAESVKNN
eukprot:TRINITY_DN3545_c0_g1_i1.p1 TRINITY_DN3545_c0_g1~~TRINITY_DN3545_c0_g1_i1.p1  ORF type:complete len:652 (-),score=165.44 TRINITY_DN3545_c0_g1_i1:23-1783(-)